MKSPVLDKSVEIIFTELKGIISENEFTEFSAKKNENEKYTQTIFRTYEGEKMSRMVVEQYTVNSKAYGVVLNIYPKPEYGIPILTFQLGGQIPDRVIFVLDMIPVIQSEVNKEIAAVYKKHAAGMDNLGSSQEWINQICSENALICQYKPLEPEKILNALDDYLCFWRDKFYLPAKPDLPLQAQVVATGNILKFKSILHANDAGLDIYLKKFGKAMVSAIESAAFGSAPSLETEAVGNLEKETGDNLEKQDTSIKTESQGGNITWSDDAEQYLQDAPKFIRAKIRSNAEKKAAELGIMEISREFIANLRSGNGT